MRKRFLPILFLVMSVFACTPEQTVITLSSLLGAGSGTWKVSFAKFGEENAPSGMYDRFTIQFKADGSYVVVNPDGSVAFTAKPTGSYKEGTTPNTLVFDGNVTVREIVTVRTANKLTFEWEVSIPGKVTTTYRIELTKTN
jgi:hypothetical protein